MWNSKQKYRSWVGVLMVLLMLTFTGCKTSKQAAKNGMEESAYLSLKVVVTIPHGDAVYSVNGTMKLKKNEIVQVSFLMPILRSEVARIEITPETILLVDRMNHRYVRTTKEELKDRLPRRWTYNRLEDLIYQASEPDGKKTISGEEFGLAKLEKARVELSDFSQEENNVKPTTLSSRYTEVTLDELLQFLLSL
jgi:hypothetical protein